MEHFSVREYANARGVTMNGVYRRLWEGKLPGIKIDGQWRILASKATESPAESLEARAHEDE